MSAPEKKVKKAIASEMGYVVEEFLGGGAFSTGVYRTRIKLNLSEKLIRKLSSEKLDSKRNSGESVPVALKLCKGKDKRQLKNEYTLLSSVEHEHIVRLLSAVQRVHHSYALLMELVEGADLFVLISQFHEAKNALLPLVAGQRVCASLLRALIFLRSRGIVHNDIKPENVLVGAAHAADIDLRTAVKLCDFGLATEEKNNTTSTGSPAWCSPEKLFRDGLRFTHASDMFSFGLVTYSLFTGRMAFSTGLEPGCEVHQLTRARYDEMYQVFHRSVNHGNQHFYTCWPSARNLTLGASAASPERRITPLEALELGFFSLKV